jgi:hypothetical protein
MVTRIRINSMDKKSNQASDNNEQPKLPSTPNVEDLLKRLACLGQEDQEKILESPELQELLKFLELGDAEELRQRLDDPTKHLSQPFHLLELGQGYSRKPASTSLSTLRYIDYDSEDKVCKPLFPS